MKLFTDKQITFLKERGATDASIQEAVDRKVAKDARTYPIESQPVRTGPRTAELTPARVFDTIADEGEDALGRSYDDGAFIEQYASLGGVSPIPLAGAGPSFEGDTRDIDNDPTRFTTTVGGRLPAPAQPYLYNEVEPMKMPGGMRLLSPANSGLADAAPFVAPEPATVVKREAGIFSDAVFAPVPGSNRFDAPRVSKSAKPLGEGMFADIVE